MHRILTLIVLIISCSPSFGQLSYDLAITSHAPDKICEGSPDSLFIWVENQGTMPVDSFQVERIVHGSYEIFWKHVFLDTANGSQPSVQKVFLDTVLHDGGYYPIDIQLKMPNYHVDSNGTNDHWVDTVDVVLKPVVYYEDNTDFLTSNFTNSSKHFDSVYWDFGDGTWSNDINPVHIWPWTALESICLLVTLKAINRCFSDSITQPIFIHYTYPEHEHHDFYTSGNDWTVQFEDSYMPNDSKHWDFGDGDTSILSQPIHTYSSPDQYGCFLVKLTRPYHCGYQQKWKLIAVGNYPPSDHCQADYINGVEIIQINYLQFFPNPATNQIQIDLPHSGTFNLTIADSKGAIVLQKLFTASEMYQVDISTLASGNYAISMTDNETTWTQKLIKP